MKNLVPGLTKPELFLGFGVKILMGLVYGYIFLHYYKGDDTWLIHRSSLAETRLLLNDPLQFFINEYTPVHALTDGRGWWHIISLYLTDLEYALLVKTLAIFNLVSQGNYYVNVVLFNAIVLWGHYWLFRALCALFPDRRKLFFAVLFLFLPAIFWLSGIRADGLLFFFFGLMMMALVKRKSIFLTLTGFIGVLIFRPAFAVLLLLSLTAFLISIKTKKHPVRIFLTVYAVSAILFFTSTWIFPDNNLTHFVINRQHEFLELKGTAFQLNRLEPSIKSFLITLPQAVANTFFRPFPWEAKGMLQLSAAAEILMFWTFVIAAMIKRGPDWKLRLIHPVILMLLFFSISVLIFIGYTVPFPGAIIRYKIIPELLLLSCIAAITKPGYQG